MNMEVVETMELPRSSVAGIRVVELTLEDEVELQRFFEAAPGYFLAVNGEPATPNRQSARNFQVYTSNVGAGLPAMAVVRL
ncbi:hypothetical protein [Pseudomonas yamanorum]|uniref:hypothetical protein n=1 Tax=Pseudomonas yamanorum TaxID=515393 RepID=UPI0035298737